jgi:hypothetical protein
MYSLIAERIEGTIQIRNSEVKYIDRKILFEQLEKAAQKELDDIKKHDYNVLMEGIMGIEAIILEKHIVHVAYSQKAIWKKESEGIISDNDRLIRFLREIYNLSPINSIRRSVL